MEKKPACILYWSRRDFRLTDNPALTAAVLQSKTEDIPLLPVCILEDYMTCNESTFGYTSRVYLSHILPRFVKNFKNFFVTQGKVVEVFSHISKHYHISIHVNEDVYVDFYSQVKKLAKKGFTIHVHKDRITVDKETVSGTGNMYTVFTPFKKAVWKSFLQEPICTKVKTDTIQYLDDKGFESLVTKKTISLKNVTQEHIFSLFSKDRTLSVHGKKFNIDTVLDTVILPDALETHISKFLYFDEQEAQDVFKKYIEHGGMLQYNSSRDSLECDAGSDVYNKTSYMSTALTWGLVSSRYLTHVLMSEYGDAEDFFHINWFDPKTKNGPYAGVISYLSELIWREFYGYLLFHKPELMHVEFQEKFRNTIKWVEKDEAHKRFVAWMQGETGYPIVDAAMRQLAQTGLMHNRARMIVSSILTKNLGVDWRWGQEYFKAMLLDLDEASNNGGWQWGASVGADPKPIRIFNPYLQAENYDGDGVYQKKWLGDARLANALPPIVEHKTARDEAMKRYGLGEESGARDY